MTNKTTKQYQKGMSEFTHSFVNPDNPENEWHKTYPYHLKYFIKQHTLSILQSEYDRLEVEKDPIPTVAEFKELMKKDFLGYGTQRRFGRNQAIKDQQSHLLQTINEIKGL